MRGFSAGLLGDSECPIILPMLPVNPKIRAKTNFGPIGQNDGGFWYSGQILWQMATFSFQQQYNSCKDNF